jgi:hypothetical protein
MRPSEKIEKFIKNIDIDTNVTTDNAVLGDVIETFEKSKVKRTSATGQIVWRIIMRNRITKLAAAAVIATVVLGGISFWSGGSDNGKWWLGPSKVWAQEILAALETVKGVTCREQNVLVMADGSEHKSSTWDILYISSDSYRRDIYDGDFLREIQWYIPDGDGTLHHSIRYDLKSYFVHSGEGSFGNYNPVERMRFYVNLLDEADQLLGEEVIDGYSCVGFEIRSSKYGDNPGDWIDCIWFDKETKLPVRIEKRGRPVTNQPDKTFTTIQNEFDYNPELSDDTFIPETPEGFIHAHPDEIKTNN